MSYRILIIDDSADYRVLLRAMIMHVCKDCQIEEYDPVALGKPQSDFSWSKFDIALLDYNLGEENGLDWLAEFNSLPGFPPVIFMTGEGSERIAARAIKFGAEDYLPKDEISRNNILEIIKSATKNWDTRLHKKDEKKLFLEALEKARVKAKQQHSALFFIEIDQSKALIDQHGESFLSSIVDQVASIVSNVSEDMSTNSYVFRYSQHEFAFVLNDTLKNNLTEALCKRFAKQLLKQLTQKSFKHADISEKCTFSIGVSLISDADSGVRDIIKKADAACSAVRVRGGNDFFVFPLKFTRKPSSKKSTADSEPSISLPGISAPSNTSPTTISPEPMDNTVLQALNDNINALISASQRSLENTELIRKRIKGEEYKLQYTAFANMAEDRKHSEIFHVSILFQDDSRNPLSDQHIRQSAVAESLTNELDLNIVKKIIKQSIQYRKQHGHAALFLYHPYSSGPNTLPFLKELSTILSKSESSQIGSSLLFQLRIEDYIFFPSSAVDVMHSLHDDTGTHFCVQGIRDPKMLMLSKHRKVFDHAIFAVEVFSGEDNKVDRDQMGRVISTGNLKLLIDDVANAEYLMNALIYVPDYIKGEYISETSDEPMKADNTVTHIQM